MSSEIRVRAATASDAPALGVLIDCVQRLHVAARPDVFKATGVAELATWASEAVSSGRVRVIVAESGGAVVGYAVVLDEHRTDNVFGYERRWREVEQLGVDPAHRRRGVAGALLEHIAVSARADGIPAVELNTWAFNLEARAAFERRGFVPKNVRYELRR